MSRAALCVGYDDASYFTRDCRRFFGAPPREHIARLRREFQSTP